jgi:predicted nucleotidyltransferase
MDAPALPRCLLEHLGDIERLCQAYGVARLEVFGSAADGRFDPARSDVDLIVELAPDTTRGLAERFFGLSDALESVLGRKVDLLTDASIRNPYLRRSVDASRREIYVHSPAEASG